MRQHLRFVLLGSILLAASLLLAFMPVASPAFAATTHLTRASAVQNAGNTIVLTTPFLAHAASQATSVGPAGNAIFCTATVTEGLASGYIVAQAEILCSQNVAVIAVTLLLVRNGALVGASSQVKSGVYYVYRDVVRRCSSQYHNWVATLSGNVTFPAGYVPPSLGVIVSTGSHRYRC